MVPPNVGLLGRVTVIFTYLLDVATPQTFPTAGWRCSSSFVVRPVVV